MSTLNRTSPEDVGARAKGANVPMMTPDELGEIIAAFNDVTQKLERSHEQLRAEVTRLNRELGEANAQVERSRRLAALGEMAAGIAHEVRNPLGSIRLYARMLDEDLRDRPGEQQMAKKIAGATSVIEAIVGDVLTFAKEFRLQRDEVCCREVVERALESCRHDGVPGWRSVDVEVDAADDLCFEGDAGLVQQVLVNVIRNAYEAIAEAKTCPAKLCVTTRKRVTPHGRGEVVVRVHDTGPGVTPEVVSRMFNPFFTTRSTGTGLGLAIVHRIMEAHGGNVSIRNNREMEGEHGHEPGACVELVFPQERVEAPRVSRLAA